MLTYWDVEYIGVLYWNDVNYIVSSMGNRILIISHVNNIWHLSLSHIFEITECDHDSWYRTLQWIIHLWDWQRQDQFGHKNKTHKINHKTALKQTRRPTATTNWTWSFSFLYLLLEPLLGHWIRRTYEGVNLPIRRRYAFTSALRLGLRHLRFLLVRNVIKWTINL